MLVGFLLTHATIKAQELPSAVGGSKNLVSRAVYGGLKSLNKVVVENLWAKTYGDSSYEEIQCIKQAYDGGYIVAGLQNSDVWILKLNSFGEIEWQKLYKNTQNENHDVKDLILDDSGYVVIGSATTCYPPGPLCELYGWVMKLNSSGEIVWQSGYKGGAASGFFSGHKTADGGYIVAGQGNILGMVTPYGKLWTVKLDSNGVVKWQRMFESVNNDTMV